MHRWRGGNNNPNALCGCAYGKPSEVDQPTERARVPVRVHGGDNYLHLCRLTEWTLQGTCARGGILEVSDWHEDDVGLSVGLLPDTDCLIV